MRLAKMDPGRAPASHLAITIAVFINIIIIIIIIIIIVMIRSIFL